VEDGTKKRKEVEVLLVLEEGEGVVFGNDKMYNKFLENEEHNYTINKR